MYALRETCKVYASFREPVHPCIFTVKFNRFAAIRKTGSGRVTVAEPDALHTNIVMVLMNSSDVSRFVADLLKVKHTTSVVVKPVVVSRNFRGFEKGCCGIRPGPA